MVCHKGVGGFLNVLAFREIHESIEKDLSQNVEGHSYHYVRRTLVCFLFSGTFFGTWDQLLSSLCIFFP